MYLLYLSVSTLPIGPDLLQLPYLLGLSFSVPPRGPLLFEDVTPPLLKAGCPLFSPLQLLLDQRHLEQFRKLQKLRAPQNAHFKKILSNSCAFRAWWSFCLQQGRTPMLASFFFLSHCCGFLVFPDRWQDDFLQSLRAPTAACSPSPRGRSCPPPPPSYAYPKACWFIHRRPHTACNQSLLPRIPYE